MNDEQPGSRDSDDGAGRERRGDEDQLLRETKLGFVLLILLILVFVAGMWVLSSIMYA